MGALGAVHAGLLTALAAVAVPILIHFFYRRRARILRFSAMRFVLLSHKKVARKLLLKEYLLLFLRCLLVALLALIVARPLLSRAVRGLHLGDQPAAVAIVLDNSYSMLRRDRDRDLFSRAKKQAEELLDQLNRLDRAALLLTASEEESPLTGSREELQKFLDQAEVSYGPSRPLYALRRAGQLLKAAPEEIHRIVMLTDLQRTGFDRPESYVAGESLPPVSVVDVTSGEALPANLAVGELELLASAHDREEALALKCQVHNFSDQAQDRVLVQVELGEENVGQGFVNLGPGAVEQKEFYLHPEKRGQVEGTVSVLAGDALSADDRAFFHLSGGGQVRALVVDGEPKTLFYESETFFLDQALNPRLYARSRVEPTTVTPAELLTQPLADYQVLVLANVEKLPEKTVAEIKRFVREGGGLLFTLGDQVNADFYDRLFGDLLPRELRGIASPYGGHQLNGGGHHLNGVPNKGEIRVMHLDSLFAPGAALGERHPILGVFRGPDEGDLALANFFTYFVLQQEVAPQSRVILRLTDGSPILVEKEFGRGKVILFASSADRAWNDLCIRPTFLPLFQQTVQYLAGALFGGDPGGMTAGQEIRIPCPPGKAGAVVVNPLARAEALPAVQDRGLNTVRLADTDQPGFYYLRWADRLPEGTPSAFSAGEADQVLVINLDLRESNLAKISESELKALVPAVGVEVAAGEAGFIRAAGDQVRRSELASTLLFILALAAALELVLLRKG